MATKSTFTGRISCSNTIYRKNLKFLLKDRIG
jgi:hypothetical protein